MADNDVQLEQKKRSRRRLVGAVALALFAAIVLPMVMDSEPKPSSSELQIRIPGQEGSNFATRIIAGNAPPPSSPEMPAAQSMTPPEEVSAPPSGPVEAPSPEAASGSSSASSAASAARTHEDKPAQAASSSSRASRSSERSKPSVNESERARDILEGKSAESKSAPEPQKDAAGGQKLYVQLGVFRDDANAREVLTRANAAGVKAVAIRADNKTRLRAGPFADRDAADAAVSRLKKADLNGIVVSK